MINNGVKNIGNRDRFLKRDEKNVQLNHHKENIYLIDIQSYIEENHTIRYKKKVETLLIKIFLVVIQNNTNKEFLLDLF